MKITRVPSRKLKPLPEPLATFVATINDSADDQLSAVIQHFEWHFPRSDLFQFISILNRFDKILEETCQKYQLDSIQKNPFTTQEKYTLLAIARCSRILFENCTNRNLYNSYEHLNKLLNTTDIDVLRATLCLLLRPAQRMTNPKAVPSNFVAPVDKITELARHPTVELASPDFVITDEMKKVSMSFYRTGKLEGIQHVQVEPNGEDLDFFWKLVNDNEIPSEYHFELLNRIRIANNISDTETRKKLVIIHYAALVIMAHTMSETIAQNRVFIYEPHLVSNIARLVCYDNHVPMDIQTYALYALDGIARHRGKVTEVLSAFNASANHGVLLHILRQLTHQQQHEIYTAQFLDGVFTLLSFLLQTPSGGQMFMSAGIISTLIQLLEHKDTGEYYTNVLIRAIGLFDTVMGSNSGSFSSFLNSNGLDVLLRQIKDQVQQCIQTEHHDTLTLVKNMLRFLTRLMESGDSIDALRNLIESSIPRSLTNIIEHPKVFGANVFALAINVATTFIHNEPTSLSVLQELGLPQAFLSTFGKYDDPNCEVLMASAHAFGAICLNKPGLDMFNEANPLPHFFELMTHHSFVTNPVEVGGATALGTTMDELIRHHPPLKQQVFQCATYLLQKVVEVGKSDAGKPLDNCHLLAQTRRTSNLNEKAECVLLGFVDLVSRFLEGFLRNRVNIEDFVKYGGLELILSYYTLPMLPFDFSISNAFDSLSYVFRMLAEVYPLRVAMCIADKVRETSAFVSDTPNEKSLVYEHTVAREEYNVVGNELYRKFSVLFGYIGLLSTVYASAILTTSSDALTLVNFLVYKDKNNLFTTLGRNHRFMVWENTLLREAVPKSWYASSPPDDVDLKDPQVINVRRFKVLLGEITPALMPVFQGIIKTAVTFQTADGATKKRAIAIGRSISAIFIDNLKWIDNINSVCKYDYYASAFSMIPMLLLDDKLRSAIITPIAMEFDAQGGTDILCDILDKCWLDTEGLLQSNGDEDAIKRINTAIELALAILQHLGSSKLLQDSSHSLILSRRGSRGGSKTIDPWDLSITFQVKISRVFKYMKSPHLLQYSRTMLNSLLRCLTQNLKEEGESKKVSEDSVDMSIPDSSTGPAPLAPNSDLVEHLVASGVDRRLAENTAVRFENRRQDTIDYLTRTGVLSQIGNGQEVVDDDNDDDYEDISTDEEMDMDSDSAASAEHRRQNRALLTDIRKRMRDELPGILAEIAEQRTDVDTEVRNLMAVLCCGNPAQLKENTIGTMKLFFSGGGSAEDKEAFRATVCRLRIFALMLREPTMQQVISLLIISMSNYVVWNDFMNIVVSYPEFPDPEWLTTLFLILEVGLAQADEPKKVPSASDEQDSKSEIEDSPDIFSHVSRTGLLRNCVDILKLEKLNQDNLVSVLRVIVRLTKHHSSAKMFLEIGGLDVIFRRPRTGLEAIKIQQAYIIMILRNIMEDESLLKSLMQEWFTFWFEIRPSPNLTVESFLKTGSNVVLRDPDVFVQVSCKMLRLNKQQHIRYVGDKVEFPEDYLKAEYSPVIINYLLNEFIQVHSQEEKEDDNITVAYTGFLLQCILELVTSYHACKHDVIQFGSQSSTDDKDNGRIRQSILYTFINDLLPYNAINPSTDKARKKQGISMWTASILVALCYDNFTNQPTDKVPRAELSQVRKHVLDVLSRSFKDTIQSTNISASAKYIKYFSLAELCHRILNARPTTITSQSNKEDTVFTLAQLMLDKGFVPILTSAIGDVDVSYPHAKMILNSILRPLEQLTKLANRLDRSAKNENKGDGKEDEEDDNYSLMDMDEVEESDAVEEEASNLFRNSSLAMFDGTVLEEESSEEDSDDEMASSGEEEIVTSDEHEYNTASDGFNTESDDDEEDEESDTDDDDDDDDDDDEDSEDMEMDELMRSHRYHHTDTEEEEMDDMSSMDDDSSDDDDSDSSSSSYSSSYETESESLNSDRSDSVHSENSDEAAWQVEDVGESTHRVFTGHVGRRRHRHSAEGTHDDNIDVDSTLENGQTSTLIPSAIEVPSRNNLNTNRTSDRDNIILHPLLRSNGSNVAVVGTSNPSTHVLSMMSSANHSHLQAYEDIIGVGAVRILENLIQQHQQRSESLQESNTNADQPTKDTLALLQEFQPLQTVDRWLQQVQMVYIPLIAATKAVKLEQEIKNRLTEIYQESNQEEDVEMTDTEKFNHDMGEYFENAQEGNSGLLDDHIEDETEEEEEDEEEGVVVLDPEVEEEEEIVLDPVFVTINGEQVDISGTGIDVEFLEALPDDLRAEVYSQAVAERRISVQSMDEDALNAEFLAALPVDMRDELLRQEDRERSRREQREHSSHPTENEPATANSRQVSQADAPMHSNVQDALELIGFDAIESSNAGWRVMHSPASQTSHARSSSNRRAILQRDALRLVDRSQLATLARLLFVPQSISKALLNKLLLNLCENSLTRIDLLSLLVCILQDGSSDLAGVDRSFTELSLQPIKPLDSRPSTVDENVPNLITQRCLEILYYVVSWNDRSLAYFLSENDSLGHLKKPNRKGRHATPKYPLLVLIGLLDRPTFMNNTTLMEQLMNLLATICRCFPNLVKRYKARLENKKESEDKRSQAPLPVIPDSCLHKIVHVLSSGVCSSHAFQYTLSVLSHISSLDGTLEAIVQELKSTAEASGHQITKDLTDLLKILKTLDVGAELEGNALSQFSAATSHQTKLLRVLKAMDYLYTRKRKHSNQPAEDNEKKVVQIYESMDFRPLWKMLGQCLSTIQEREDLINVATVLLPLVESFMAVSKYSTSKQYTTKQDESSYFFTFTEDHKKILNIMVRNNSSLMSGSFSLLVNNPKILEFDNKRNYFIQQLHKRNEPRKHYPPLQLNVRRAHVFQDTYQQFEGHSGSEIKNGKLNVRFRNEEGVDAGGVAREWFSVLARQMFDPNYALFITSAADKLTYQPNRASGVNSDHLSYFKFVGRVIGKAIHDGRLLDAYFTRSFYKQLLGRSVDYRDVEAVDPTYYNSLVWMLENDITDIIDLTFSVETDDFGTNKIIDLKPNGRDIPVTEANKHEYVSLITEHKLVLAIKDQVNAFLQGFHDIIPPQLIQIFNEQELELLISGLPDIDIDEWKANTVYQGYSLSSPQIQWFWRAVRSFDQEEKAKLLQFSTGTSKVPLEGFAQLQGSNGVQKFQIHKEFGDANRLPSAHTCFNQIDLPQYQSYDDLRTNLFKAISECSTGFGFV